VRRSALSPVEFSNIIERMMIFPIVLQLAATGIPSKQQEFEREAVPHMELLYNYALRLTANADDASDLLQETFMKAYRFWDKYEIGTNIRAWLFRIMKNSYINRYRRETKTPETVDYEDVQNFYTLIKSDAVDANDLQEKIFGGLLDDDITRALESLPEDFRTVVILCDIEGLTYEEIAEFVNCPIGTVRSRLHRGRKMLRAKLFDYAKKRGFVTHEKLKD
jgi:RNA polymerase sigma-70 factor (ECF subfamily)